MTCRSKGAQRGRFSYDASLGFARRSRVGFRILVLHAALGSVSANIQK